MKSAKWLLTVVFAIAASSGSTGVYAQGDEAGPGRPPEKLEPEGGRPDGPPPWVGMSRRGDRRGFDRGSWMFQRIDQDEDGKISQDEYLETQKRVFEGLDQDGDGFLTREEFRPPGLSGDSRRRTGGPDQDKSHEERMRRMFGMMDRNDDGVVTAEEFRGPREVFPLIDKNTDGKLTQEEFTTHIAPSPPPPDADFFERIIKERDTDKDGKLTEEEIGHESPFFKEIDTNNDGALEASELTERAQKDPPIDERAPFPALQSGRGTTSMGQGSGPRTLESGSGGTGRAARRI